MRILTIADPLHTFNLKKDSTYAILRELARRGAELYACEPQHIAWQSDAHSGQVTAQAQQIALTDPDSAGSAAWFSANNPAVTALAGFDAVLMRKDPPFDAEYIYATHLLSAAERQGARVFNAPRALREHPEKLALLEFAEFAPPTLVSKNASDIRAFHAQHGEVILKPLDGMGGMGIFKVGADGLNLGSIVETLTANGSATVMVQRYLPQIAEGDKRVLLINGHVVPFALARIPQGGEVRGNLAAGGKGVALPLTERERTVALALAPVLAARGLFLVGLDLIGDHLTEVNVTSPTCFQEITAQTGFDVAGLFVDELLGELAEKNTPSRA